MEIAKGLSIPIKPDPISRPEVYYGEPMTAICFSTDDDEYGRITFENLDAIKVSRGENLPFKNEKKEVQSYFWASKVENSNWLRDRYAYEKMNYEGSYEFGGNVKEMLTDFSHYIFKFHDEFVEAIARGFWFEKDTISLSNEPLQEGHPFLPIQLKKPDRIVAHNLTCEVVVNKEPIDVLISKAQFCSQKLIEFALDLEGNTTVDHTLILAYRNGKLISSLRGSLGQEEIAFERIATLQDVKPYIERFMGEVYERRRKMGK